MRPLLSASLSLCLSTPAWASRTPDVLDAEAMHRIEGRSRDTLLDARNPQSVIAADVDGDGATDLVFATDADVGAGRLYVRARPTPDRLDTPILLTDRGAATPLDPQGPFDASLTGRRTTANDGDGLGRVLWAADVDGDGADDLLFLRSVADPTAPDARLLGFSLLSGADLTGHLTRDALPEPLPHLPLPSSLPGVPFTTGAVHHLLGPVDGDANGDGVLDRRDDLVAQCFVEHATCLVYLLDDIAQALHTPENAPDTLDALARYRLTKSSSGPTRIGHLVRGVDADGDGQLDLVFASSGGGNNLEINVFFGPLSDSLALQDHPTDPDAPPALVLGEPGPGDFAVYRYGADSPQLNTTSSFRDFTFVDLNRDGHPEALFSYRVLTGEGWRTRVDVVDGASIATLRQQANADHPTTLLHSPTRQVPGLPNSHNLSDVTVTTLHVEVSPPTALVLDTPHHLATGDVNGDGWPDLILGCSACDGPDETAGAGLTFLILAGEHPFDGGDLPLTPDAPFVSAWWQGRATQEQLGQRVLLVDLDHNGLPEVFSASARNPGTASTHDTLTYVLWNHVTDRDGDGFPSARLGDDGRYHPYDCDDFDPDNQPQTFYRDADGDGFGDPEVSIEACEAPEGYVDNPDDCDDTDPNAHPDRPENCPGASDGFQPLDPDPPAVDEPEDEAGCGCATPAGGPPGWAGFGPTALVVLALRRRRRGAPTPRRLDASGALR